jgi:7-cyano-7-deazaguanine synthase
MHNSPLAVLISGGLDSAILLGEALRSHEAVYPLYTRCGLFYEADELAHLHRYLDALRCPALQPLHILHMPVADLYGEHWSLTGKNVPARDTPDEAVFMPGRNVLLLVKAVLWCHLNGVNAIALAALQSNPFPDATPAFFAGLQDVMNSAVGGTVEILRPYAGLHKVDVMRRGAGLPLGHSFSCISPRDGRHCGECNKCAERQLAFASAGMDDPTIYFKKK